ncbi:MAG: hypothetical protein AAGD43_02315 [Pseudomonadota bacterium]
MRQVFRRYRPFTSPVVSLLWCSIFVIIGVMVAIAGSVVYFQVLFQQGLAAGLDVFIIPILIASGVFMATVATVGASRPLSEIREIVLSARSEGQTSPDPKEKQS